MKGIRSNGIQRAIAIILLLIGPTSTFAEISSQRYGWLEVRFETGLKKTFLAGPYAGDEACKKNMQKVWDSLEPTCEACKRELQMCVSWTTLTKPFQDVMKRERSEYVKYVIATDKHRIIISGASKTAVETECERSAEVFRSNGYPDAVCVR